MADFTAIYQDVAEVLPQVQYLLGDNQWVDSTPTYDGAANPLTDTYQGFDGVVIGGTQNPSFGILWPKQ